MANMEVMSGRVLRADRIRCDLMASHTGNPAVGGRGTTGMDEIRVTVP
jgi:hypothetical protein